MKKLLLLLTCIIIITVSCKKDKSPQPVPVASPTTSGLSITAVQHALVGKWQFDSVITWQADTISNRYIFALQSTNQSMKLDSVNYNSDPGWYDATMYINTTTSYSNWRVITIYNEPYYQMSNVGLAGYIRSVPTTTLVLFPNALTYLGRKSGDYCYFHRI